MCMSKSWGQTLEWLDYAEDNQDQITRDITVDVDGNVIQIIQNKPWVPSQPWAGGPYVIRKVNPVGIEQWSIDLNVQKAVSIDTDSNGDIFILGCSGQTTDLNPDPNVADTYYANANFTGNFNRALFVLKLNSLGEFLTFSTIGEYPGCDGGQGCSIYSYPQQIKVDHEDNVLFSFLPRAGGFIDIDPSSNTEIISLNPRYFTLIKWTNDLDDLVWVNYMYGNQEEYYTSDNIDITPKGVAFDIDNSNNIYVASVNDENIILSKYSKEGTLLNNPWETLISGYGYNNIGDISVLSDNEVILGGTFINNIDLNPIQSNPSEILNTTHPITDNFGNYWNDAFLVKYDSLFNVEWKQIISSIYLDNIEDIETSQGNIYVCGLSEKDIFATRHWSEYPTYLKIIDANGTLIAEREYISPYPEDPVTNSGVFGPFKGARKINSVGDISEGWVFDWGRRTIGIIDQQCIYIGGEYSAYPPTSQGAGWN